MQDVVSFWFCYLIYEPLLKCSVGFSPCKMLINFCSQKEENCSMQRTFARTNLVGKIPTSFTSSCHVSQGFQTQMSSEVWQSDFISYWQLGCTKWRLLSQLGVVTVSSRKFLLCKNKSMNAILSNFLIFQKKSDIKIFQKLCI